MRQRRMASGVWASQLARARLGYKDIVLRTPPELPPERRAAIAQLDVVRATELLYAIGERDLVVPFVADLGEKSSDIGALAELSEIAGRNKDARSMVLIGKAALGHGYALERYAFPTIGIPDYQAIGPAVVKAREELKVSIWLTIGVSTLSPVPRI